MDSGSQAGPGTRQGEARAAMLVASLASELLGGDGPLDRRIEAALADLGRFAGVDRAYVIRIREGGTFDNTHEWVAEGIPPGKDALQDMPVSRMNPDLHGTTGPIFIPSVPDLPEDAPHRDHLVAQDIRSLLITPMINRGRRIGLVGFDWVRAPPPADAAQGAVPVLSAVAALVTTAILRAESEAEAETVRGELARAEARLRTAFAAVPDAVLDVDGRGRILVAHSRLRGLFTDTPEVLVGRTIEAALPAPLAEACRRCLAGEAGARAGAAETVTWRPAPGAETLWLEIIATPHGAGGRKARAGSVLVLRDVTAERLEQAERELLDQVARRTRNLVVVTDAERRITWVNEAFERLSGWTLDEIRGRNPGTFLHCNDTDPAEIARLRVALDAGRPIRSEILNCTRSGERYWIEMDIQPVRDPDGRLRGFHSVQTDISERKADADQMARTARSAVDAHRRLRDAVEALPDAFAWFDSDDRLVLCNKRYREVTPVRGKGHILGMTFEELIRAMADNRIRAGESLDTEAWVAARLATHRKPGQPYVLRLLSGRWMKIHEKRTADGGCVTMLVDVTAEREAAQRLEDTLDAARAGAWEWHLDATDRLVIDDRIAHILGYDTAADLGELTVARWQALMHPDDRTEIGDGWEALRTDTENVSDHVYRVRHRDGRYIWVLSRGRMLVRGGPRRIGVVIDVSERKRLEAELEAERDYLETLTETSMSAITALDAEGRIVYANREAEQLFGLNQSEIEARSYDAPGWRSLNADGSPLAPEDMPFQRVRRTGQPVRDQRMSVERGDGRRQIISVNAAPVDAPESPIRVVCSIRDVTAEMAAEAALHEALARAKEATEAKSRFLASMSHEIRTPLNGVLGMAELLDLSLTEPRHREMVGVIRESGSLLLSLLNDILDMSKIEAGKLELELAPFVPATLVGAVEALHTVAARRKGIELVVWAGVGLDRPRMGDAHRIQQVLHNLVGNAVKFTETGEVAVTLTVKGGGALSVRVRDTGPGMTEEQLGRVFEEFEQADGTIARRHGGSGLGLAIVHRLVGLMNGEITIDSAPGRGTDIRVTLPLAEAPAEITGQGRGARQAPRATDGPGLSGLRALVAEDNGTNRLILKAMLDRLGVEATIVGDGTDAVAAWRPDRYDLLLLDITMPVMGGIETLGVIRAAAARDGAPAVPAIAITANAMTHQIDEYLAAGFDAHLSKPLSLGALESTLGRIAQQSGRLS